MEAAWETSARLRADPPPLDSTPAEERPPAARLSRRALAGGLLAASVAAAGVGVAWSLIKDVRLYRTRVGEQRTVALDDGSRVRLNTASAIEVAMNARERRVELVRGEALFEVAHDTARPFLVDAGPALLRAVGTAFNVRLRNDIVELTVTEGVVAVLENGEAVRRTAPHIPAGGGAVIRSGAVAPTELGDEVLRQRTAWQDGVIELEGETLGQAVDEFNRYRTQPILIGDARLSTIRVGGRFEVDEADKFLTALQSSFPVEAIRSADGSVMLVTRN